MQWRNLADAFYRSACERGLGPQPQTAAVLRQRLEAGAGLDTPVASVKSAVLRQRLEAGAGESEEHWGVACSGGADSLALLLWLYGAAQNGHWGNDASAVVLSRLRVLHLDHGLRGEASRGDAAFVAEVAASLGLPLYAETVTTAGASPATGDAPSEVKVASVASVGGTPQSGASVTAAGVSLADGDAPSEVKAAGDTAQDANLANQPPSEALLRQWRQDFFMRSGCAIIFQGHHRGDVAETLLMRLAAGSGLDGLCAPRPVSAPFVQGSGACGDGAMAGSGQPVYLRPLLDWSKAEIVEMLEALRIPWREDASNATGDYFRNRVRRDVLPALATAAERDVLACMAQTRQLLQEDAEALDFWFGQLWQKAFLPEGVPSLPPANRQSTMSEKKTGSAGSGKDMLSAASGDAASPGVREERDCAASLFAAAGDAASSETCAGLPSAAVGVGGGQKSGALNWAVFALQPLALRRRALWRALVLWRLADAFTGAGVGALLRELEGRTAAAAVGERGLCRFSAGKEAFLVYCPQRQVLWVEPAADFHAAENARERFAAEGAAAVSGVPLAAGQVVRLPCGGTLACQLVALDDALRTAIRAGRFPCEREVFLAITENSAGDGDVENAAEAGARDDAGEGKKPPQLFARCWQAGDSYRPLGAPGRRKVQDCFTDRKIPRGERHLRPVVVNMRTGAILWVAGLPPAHERAITGGTKSALRLTYTPGRKTVAPYLI